MRPLALCLCPLVTFAFCAASCSPKDDRVGTRATDNQAAPPRAQDDAVAAAATRPAGEVRAATNPATQPQKPQEEVSNPKSLVRPEKP
jgi:hypothetical protein